MCVHENISESKIENKEIVASKKWQITIISILLLLFGISPIKLNTINRIANHYLMSDKKRRNRKNNVLSFAL